MTKLNEACARRLAELADSDPAICVLDGDLADSNGAEFFQNRRPDRFFQMGIAEQTMVAAAGGMAICGLRPWVFSFSAFLAYRACDSVRSCVANVNLPVVLVGSHSGGLSGRNGQSHAALSDLAVFRAMPGFAIWSPASLADLFLAMSRLSNACGPGYLRLPRASVDDLSGPEPDEAYWVTPPMPVAIVASGIAVYWALETRKMLCQIGVHSGVLNVCKVAPLAENLPVLLSGVKSVFVVEDHSEIGGLASAIREKWPYQHFFSRGWPSGWRGESGEDGRLREAFGLAGAQLADWIAKLLKF